MTPLRVSPRNLGKLLLDHFAPTAFPTMSRWASSSRLIARTDARLRNRDRQALPGSEVRSMEASPDGRGISK